MWCCRTNAFHNLIAILLFVPVKQPNTLCPILFINQRTLLCVLNAVLRFHCPAFWFWFRVPSRPFGSIATATDNHLAPFFHRKAAFKKTVGDIPFQFLPACCSALQNTNPFAQACLGSYFKTNKRKEKQARKQPNRETRSSFCTDFLYVYMQPVLVGWGGWLLSSLLP